MLTTVVGNYPKIGMPSQAPNIRSAIHRLDKGQISRQDLLSIQQQVVTEVIKQQVDSGLDLVSDGQIGRDDGQTYFAKGIRGFNITGLIRYFDTNTYYRQPEATSQVSWTGPISVDDFVFAQGVSNKPVKAILTGPYTLAKLSKRQNNQSVEQLAKDLALILNQEAKALEKAGAQWIQFDEPAIGRWNEDFSILQKTSELVTEGLTSKTAIYTWFHDIADLAPDFFHLPYEVIGLDFIRGPRNWDVLSFFPSDKSLGLGIIDGRNTRLEPIDEIIDGIKRANEHVAQDHIHLNPSCGLDYLPRKSAYDKLVQIGKAAKAIT